MAQDDPFAAFADPIDAEYAAFAEPVGLSPEAYTAEYQRRFDAGASKDELIAFMRQNGVDPANEAKYLDDVIAARAAGRRVQFTPGEAQKVDPETFGQAFYRGVGDVAEGVGDLVGLAANPLNGLLNWTGLPQAIMGRELTTDLGATARDATGAPDPVTGTEKIVSAATQGGAGALATFGAGAAASPVSQGGQAVARALTASPVADTVAGLTGGAAAEVGEQQGGAAGGLVGAVAGGATGYGLTRAAERLVGAVPREVLLDNAGNLSEEGRELAARYGAREEDVVREARVRETRLPPRTRDQQAAREAARANPNRPQGDVRSQPTARAPEPAPDLNARTDAILRGMRERIESGEPFEGSGRPPLDPRDPFTEAAEEGIQLTRGQAEQNFKVQNDENSLRVTASREGNTARAFFQQQSDQINSAVTRFRQAFGSTEGGAAERGQTVKDALREMRDAGAEGVRRMYREAEELGGEGLTLDTDGIYRAAEDVLIDEAVPEGTKRAIGQELARYGIIGSDAVTNEAGLTRVTLTDGSTVSFRGPVKQLTASNAEDLRRAINRLYDPMKPNLSGQSIKPAIDDALEAAIEGAAGREGGIGQAYQAARDAYRAQKQTFAAKDIVENLIAYKKGTANAEVPTESILPERGIAQILGTGKEGVSNLRKTKNLLMSRPSPSSQQAWQAIQQQALADIFDGAIVRNANPNGEIGETISGAKLRTAIFEKYGASKLRELLDPQDFDQLMKLQRIIGAATIPMTGTVNSSGTFTKLANFMGKGALRFTGGLGDAAAALVNKARELAATRKTLEGITSYDGRRSTGERLDQQARELVREYIEAGRAGKLMPSSINLTASATPRGTND